MMKTRVYDWDRNFVKRHTEFENSSHTRHPRIKLTAENIDAFQDSFEDAANYCQLLGETKRAYRRIKHVFPIRELILQHNNALPHTANLTREKFVEIHWKTLEQPIYSPELFPSD